MLLTAPPGSGKTLLVPISFWETGRFSRIFVLEPRRVAARRPYQSLKPILGPLVGYRIRQESKWSAQHTKICYLTYGTAVRWWSEEPPAGRDLLIFDEFHERSWEADLLFALFSSRVKEEPTKLLMSATLDQDTLSMNLRVVKGLGALYPVEISWEAREPSSILSLSELGRLVSRRSLELRTKLSGDQLIFLPGLKEILQVRDVLQADSHPGTIDVLHSSLPEAELARVVERPTNLGPRRILATDLAESSITLDGIVSVLDSGLVKRPQAWAPGTGSTLIQVRAPRASLEQRAGRAGRLGPGLCHRLFTRNDELHRPYHGDPEIREQDPYQLALALAAWKALTIWKQLSWIENPTEERVALGVEWLLEHGLLEESGTLSERGHRLHRMALAPLSALLALRGRESGMPTLDCLKLLWVLDGSSTSSPEAKVLSEQISNCRTVDRSFAESVAPTLESIQVLSDVPVEGPGENLDRLILECFADRLVEIKPGKALPRRTELRTLEILQPGLHDWQTTYAVALKTGPSGNRGSGHRLELYHPISEEALWEQFLSAMVEERELFWEREKKQVRQLDVLKLGQLVLEQTVSRPKPGCEVAEVLFAFLESQDYGEGWFTLCRRLELLLEKKPDLKEELDRNSLGIVFDSLEQFTTEVLKAFLRERNAWKSEDPAALKEFARAHLPYGLTLHLDKQLPEFLHLPRSRKPVKIEYRPEQPPTLAAKIQDFFDWDPNHFLPKEQGFVFQLLAPNGRPVQITSDLEGFWKGSYSQVRKDLRGRYPKHHWPEDPSMSKEDRPGR